MKRQKLRSAFIGGLFASALLIFLGGCLKESNGDCSTRHTLVVRAYDIDNNEITDQMDGSVLLYLFDSNGFFIEHREVTAGTQIELLVPKDEQITAIAWAEYDGDNCLFPLDLVAGERHVNSCAVILNLCSRADAAPHDSPGDLFSGNYDATYNASTTDNEIPVYRRTGSMSITVRKMREHVGATGDDNDFSIVVHETENTLDFYGAVSGDKVAAYTPAGSFNSAGLYNTGIFNMLPSTDGISIDVYHGDELLRTVSTFRNDDGSQTPITVAVGMTTNVLIDFSAIPTVEISINDWGILESWKSF